MWVEKTPSHINFLDDIFRLRKNSRVVVMMRDPRDVACSYRSRGFTFEVGLQKWIKAYSSMSKWKGDKRVYMLKLEDLVSNANMHLNRLMVFLELPNVNLLDYYEKKVDWYAGKTVESKPEDGLGENHEVLRNWQINQPLFSSTKRYDKEMDDSDWEIYRKYELKIRPILSNPY